MANKRQSRGCLLLFCLFLLSQGHRGRALEQERRRDWETSLCIGSILKAVLCYAKRQRLGSGALDFKMAVLNCYFQETVVVTNTILEMFVSVIPFV